MLSLVKVTLAFHRETLRGTEKPCLRVKKLYRRGRIDLELMADDWQDGKRDVGGRRKVRAFVGPFPKLHQLPVPVSYGGIQLPTFGRHYRAKGWSRERIYSFGKSAMKLQDWILSGSCPDPARMVYRRRVN